MYYVGWLISGFVLLGVSGFVENIGDVGATSGERLPFYLLAFGILVGAGYCFVKGGSGVWKSFRDGFDAPEPLAADPAQEFRPARRLADSEYAVDSQAAEFDANNALERYMERRKATPPANGVQARAVAVERSRPQSRPAFGRKSG